MIKRTVCCDICGSEVMAESAAEITTRLIGTRWKNYLESLLPKKLDVCYECYMETYDMWSLFKNRGKTIYKLVELPSKK
jgi:hypothetical protein